MKPLKTTAWCVIYKNKNGREFMDFTSFRKTKRFVPVRWPSKDFPHRIAKVEIKEIK